jgi:hypothetical protein
MVERSTGEGGEKYRRRRRGVQEGGGGEVEYERRSVVENNEGLDT